MQLTRLLFDLLQYRVKPTVFKLLRHNQQPSSPEFVATTLDDRQILPFTEYDNDEKTQSGNSKVVRVKIHPAHHDFDKEVHDLFPCSNASTVHLAPSHSNFGLPRHCNESLY